MRYDAIGYTDDEEVLRVLVCEEPEPGDGSAMHVRALRHAIAFAHGTRFDPEEYDYPVDARGFAAFELWRDAIESGAAAPKHSQCHADELVQKRGHAAACLRGLIDISPDAASHLETVAAHCDRVVETSERLYGVCTKAKGAAGFSEDTRAEARDLVTAALAAETDAIARIEAVIAALEASQ